MQICFLSSEYPLWKSGGVGSFIQTLGINLVEKGCEVTVVGIGEKNEEEVLEDKGVKIYRLPKPNITKLRFVVNFYRIRKKLKQIHLNNPIDILETAELGQAFIPSKTPFLKVIRMHGGHHYFAKSESRKVSAWRGFQEKRSFKNADYLIGVSKFVADETVKLLNLGKRKVKIIYNPVDLEVFKRNEAIEVVKGQLLFIGTVCEKKGIHKLIEATKLLLDQGLGLQLKIVGRDWINPKTNQSYIQYLKSSIPERYKRNIEFIGPVPHSEVSKWLNESEIIVLPSFMEAMPIAWLEVLAMGKPLIASQTGPGPEVVENEVTGLLCDPYNPKDIASRIKILLNDSEKCKSMGRAAREYAIKNYNIEILMDENYQYYKKLVCK